MLKRYSQNSIKRILMQLAKIQVVPIKASNEYNGVEELYADNFKGPAERQIISAQNYK